MDQLTELLLMVLEHIGNRIFVRQIGPQMGYQLAGQLVKQTRMIIVGEVSHFVDAQ